MSEHVGRRFMNALPQLRHEPTAKRIRAQLGERTVVDSTRALLVWEPRRVVASWAVPVEDIAADLVASDASVTTSEKPVLDPSVPFSAHTAPGSVVDVVADGDVRHGAGMRLNDPDLDGYVVLDFSAFDVWWEEDQRNVGHPREPFHRIDVLPSSRHVRLELDGTVLAESSRAYLLFETFLPIRFYLIMDDVTVPLRASATRSTCAYKGHASYLSPVVDGRELSDLAWTYPQPLPEAAAVAGLVSFFDERIDVELDGVRRERPVTPWS